MACKAENRGAYRVLVGKCEGTTLLRRPRLRWEDDIKTAHKEIGWEGVNLCDLAQDRDKWRDVVNAVVNIRFQ
jgi:hypothetical protein